ncbi:DUF1501 domain-containing protein [Ereboglobus luteus]|uniref:Sulfatase n=1 Tax=Ereboglobus luteus TaxID=1796921 RepID=A0A2U8E598_9BACT|nr:DUF1501 domain-containing protein [Ereboglobus luteus]AWI10108.1 hypothetical protein CKA38_13340 [Ereboglobus luteus]
MNTHDPLFSPDSASPHDPLCAHEDHASDALYRRAFDLVTRRDFLRIGALTVGGLAMAPYLRSAPASNARAKAVIQLFLFGGPSHIDTFDPKPQASTDITGPWRKTAATNVDGIQIGELLPLSAKHADKYTLLRGLSHKTNAHETATYMMQTGTDPRSGLVYPSMGAVIAYKMEEAGLLKGRALPAYMTVPVAIGRFSETGFLGPRYRSFIPGNLANPISGEERAHLEKRAALLDNLDTFGHSQKAVFEEADYFRDQAREMVLGKARDAFDISKESAKTRELYGDTEFGRSCLQARRLVENGVAYVTVNMRGWDTHRDQAERYKKLMPELDRGFSALLTDLTERGMLDSTIVTCGGEFGRTPRFMTEPPWNGGRNHYGAAFSWAIAGGGFRGGQIVGETDNRGERVTKRAIAPWDLSASIYKLLGIDPDGTLPHPLGCAAYVTPRQDETAQPAKKSTQFTPGEGMLKEIMPT